MQAVRPRDDTSRKGMLTKRGLYPFKEVEHFLGLNDRIVWYYVGLPEETQLYFYKLYNKGVEGKAIDLFKERILSPLQEEGEDSAKNYFADIEEKYSKIYENHHNMPDSLSSFLIN